MNPSPYGANFAHNLVRPEFYSGWHPGDRGLRHTNGQVSYSATMRMPRTMGCKDAQSKISVQKNLLDCVVTIRGSLMCLIQPSLEIEDVAVADCDLQDTIHTPLNKTYPLKTWQGHSHDTFAHTQANIRHRYSLAGVRRVQSVN